MLLNPLWKGQGPSLEQTYICNSKRCFVLSLVEIGPVVLVKKIFKFCQYIFTLLKLSPLWKWRGPSIDHILILLTQGCFARSLIEIGPVVLEKRRQCEKFTTTTMPPTTTTTTDNGQIVIRKAHLNHRLRWAKNKSKSLLLLDILRIYACLVQTTCILIISLHWWKT